MKRKLACFGGAFALAELAAAYLPTLVSVLTAAVFALAAIIMLVRALPARGCLPVICGAALGICWALGYQCAVKAPLEQYAQHSYTCTATVETDCEPSYQEGMMRGTLHITQLDGKKVNFKAYSTAFPGLEPGEKFTAELSFAIPQDNAYRMTDYARGSFLTAEYQAGYNQITSSSAPKFMLYRLRSELSQRLRRYLPRELAAIEGAMLLGDKSRLSDTVTGNFRAAGVSHLLSVSGLHVALLCGLFTLGIGGRQFSRRYIALQGGVLVFYILLTGAPVSVLRAGVIFMIALLGYAFLQPPDLLTSLGAAAMLLGLQNAYAPCDVGFQLSFCGVLGVQLAAALTRWEKQNIKLFAAEEAEKKADTGGGKIAAVTPTAARAALRLLADAQCAALASLATLPVLLAHGLTASGVAVLTNLLVVWMLRYALILGLPVLLFSALPVFAPLMHMASLVLGLWLKIMYGIICRCAALPLAHISLPRRYTLFVLLCLAILALVFYYSKRMLWYLPAVTACAALAILLGAQLQRDVVRAALVGTAGNPCTVITQNGSAAVLFRGGAANVNAVRAYLNEQGIAAIDTVIDLRLKPTDNIPAADTTLIIEELPDKTDTTLFGTLPVQLIHGSGGNAAVVDIDGLTVAAAAGRAEIAAADIYCAAGTYPQGLSAQAVMYTALQPAWLGAQQQGTALYYGEQPTAVIRPGVSFIFEEAVKIAVQ